MTMKKSTQAAVGLALIVAAFCAVGLIVALRPPAEPEDVPAVMVPVTTTEIQLDSVPAKIPADGTVEPAVAVDMVPEVNGKVVWRSKKLVPGGHFAKNEVIARIDSRQYALAVTEERSRVRSAELELELEGGRGEIAAHEWQILKGDDPTKAPPLALRRSQFDAARVGVEAAKSALERAELELERSVMRAPFNATVVSENLALGQYVSPSERVARLVGTDEFWVRAGVRVKDLGNVQIPAVNGETGSLANVTQRLSDGSFIRRQGRVFELIEELNPGTRQAQLLISIPEPLVAGENGLPLLPGAYVEVEITGRDLKEIAAVPSSSIYDRSVIWVVENGRLARKTIKIHFSEGTTSYISGELASGMQLVTSPLSRPITGAEVEIKNSANNVSRKATAERDEDV